MPQHDYIWTLFEFIDFLSLIKYLIFPDQLLSFSGICKPIVNIDEEVIFDPRHPVLTHVNSSIPTVENKGDNVPLNVTEGKSQRTRKNKAKGSKVVKTDPEKIEKSKDPIKEDEFLEKATPSLEDRINRPNEKDKEHEKFCEELCSSCKGSENVFDLAEPSCFCKVVTGEYSSLET